MLGSKKALYDIKFNFQNPISPSHQRYPEELFAGTLISTILRQGLKKGVYCNFEIKKVVLTFNSPINY
ncbi:hypothetical protein [uncultured Sunxiuqinia sp.]|uniref:hypothetical protein n=1 Tax=uncultured Sunxiuqinia sp. TaxID=1573825 RepID=UPI002AA7F746|nr:hypothetical protein [uncultured Sunxiuqinia sp.]